MYMLDNNRTKTVLKRYIQKLIREADGLDLKPVGEVSLSAELAKTINKGFPLQQFEFSKLSESIKNSDKEIKSIDLSADRTEVTFTRNSDGTNFYFKFRKILDPADQTRQNFMYVLWYVPFQSREEINKPGNVQKKESSQFSNSFTQNQISDIIFSFITDAMLLNNS